jgi:hypothetical protein
MEWAPKLLEGVPMTMATEVTWVGAGEEVDLSAIDQLAAKICAGAEAKPKASRGSTRDMLEGELAGSLHMTLRDVPPEMLDDPGWWRYLSVRIWEFVVWREADAFETGDYRKYRRYIDAKVSSECVPMRMYLRAAIARVGDDYSLASAVKKGSDLWRSHILRVRTGTAPALARALVMEQLSARMPTDELRPFASKLNRLWPNVVLNLYTEDEARDLLTELRQSQP